MFQCTLNRIEYVTSDLIGVFTMGSTTTPRPVDRAMRQVGIDLRTWRKLRRLTVAQVADRAGLERRTVMNLEAGRNPTLETTLRVARALGVLDQLVDVLDPYNSDVGRLRANEQLPIRVHAPRVDTT